MSIVISTSFSVRAATALRNPRVQVDCLHHRAASESTESTGYLLKDRIADVGAFTDAVLA
jgi:hypothetical protein